MTISSLQVRVLELQQRDALFAFLQRTYQHHPLKSDPTYFEWLFAGNPSGSSLGTYCLLVTEHDHIVGQIATLRTRMRIAGAWHECLWICDLYIDSDFRGGVGVRRLYKRVMGSAPIVLATGVNASTLPIYDALGWTRLQVSHSRYHVLRPTRLAALARGRGNDVAIRGLAQTALRMADQVVPLAGRAYAGSLRLATSGLPLEEVKRFDPRWDADLERLAAECGVTEYRDAATLNWRFVERPVGRQQIFVIPTAGGGVRGMLVLRWLHAPGLARWIDVVDYLVSPDDSLAFRRLTAQATWLAAAHELDFVRFRLSLPSHVALLRRPAWVDHTRPITEDVFFVSQDPGLLEAVRSTPWHLTALASDRSETGRDEWPSPTVELAGATT
jgi:hypothetical protein